MLKLAVLSASLCAAFGMSGNAAASGDVIKIGFITDMSGTYADFDGQGGVEAIKMAIADAGGSINGKKIELVVADHQNKADIAANKAREWFDRDGVDMLIGGVNSAASLAMGKVAGEKKKVFISVGAGTTRQTNEECNAYTIQYAYDTTAAGTRHRCSDHQTRRQVVVLPDRRLCVWHITGKRHLRSDQVERRQCGWSGSRAAGNVRLLLVPVAGTSIQGADSGSGCCRRRRHQCHQGSQ